jgi:ATP-dependent 26S proteasome regulatory subunit
LRPGRIDLNIELKKASKKIVKEILSFFYDSEDIQMYINKNLSDYQYTPAEIMNICQNNIFSLEDALKILFKESS